jgi:hypothetical protein
VDAEAVQKLIVESDAEGGEIAFDDAMRHLDKVIEMTRR